MRQRSPQQMRRRTPSTANGLAAPLRHTYTQPPQKNSRWSFLGGAILFFVGIQLIL
jgi:hypothetical protein